MSNAESIGLIILLKNEVYDIAGWLAWHIALGFDTIFVIDDGSTDGTDEIVRNAALLFDIRYERALPGVDDYYQRQQNEYRRVLDTSGAGFAWLCFLDADEYLLLNSDKTVADFLSRYQHAQGIALNWRLHGSSWQVLRPLVPPPVAYVRHSNIHELINQHVKSFVRPDQQQGLHNVHAFRVESDHYLNTDGRPIQWGSTAGIIRGQPLWDKALIMHFQCRSMEHFLERVERRRDQAIDATAWINEEWNKEEDHSPSRFFSRMFDILAQIELENSRALCRYIIGLRPGLHVGVERNQPAAAIKRALGSRNTPPFKGIDLFKSFVARYKRFVKEGTYTLQLHHAIKSTLSVFRLRTHFDTVVCIDTANNLVTHVDTGYSKREDLLPVFLIRSLDVTSTTLLVRSVETNRPLRLDGARQAAIVVDLELNDLEGQQITLRTPITRLYLAAEPPDASGTGRITANRRVASEWEMFKLIEENTSEVDTIVQAMSEAYFTLLAGNLTADNLVEWLAKHDLSITAQLLQIILRRFVKCEKTRLSSLLAASVAPELLAGSQYS